MMVVEGGSLINTLYRMGYKNVYGIWRLSHSLSKLQGDSFNNKNYK